MATIWIHDVPEDLRRELEARAAVAGLSVSEYLLRWVQRSLAHPTRQELRARLAGRGSVQPEPTPAEAVRAERGRR